MYRFYTSTDLRYVHMCFTFPKSILFKVQVSDRFGLLTYLYVQKQEREYIDGNYRTEKMILEVKYVRSRNDHAASAYTTDLTNICVLTWIVNERVGR